MDQPLTDQQLEAASHRHHPAVDPAACGTCWRLVADGKTPEHSECARRATLLPAPDAPDSEALADLTDEQKAALPARFHTPVFEGNAVPNSWVCAVCWGDGWVTRWPCASAVKHGAEVFTPEHQADRARDDVPVLLADVLRLRAELAGLDDLRQRAIDKQETLRVELEQTRQQAAAVLALLPADPAEDINAPWIPARLIRAAATGQPTCTVRPCGCPARFERHADGCPTLAKVAQ